MNTHRALSRYSGLSIGRIAVVTAVLLAASLVLEGGELIGHDQAARAAVARPASTAARKELVAPLTRLVTIMPLGDSITLGGGSPTMSGYRVDLARRLAATGLRTDFVGSRRNGVGPDLNHEGHSHWTIQDIAAHVDGWLATYRPDVILLDIGTNNTQNVASAALAPAALSALIDQLTAARPTADIFVAKITSTKDANRQPIVDAFNAVVPDVVAGKGPRVHLVDQSTVGGRDLRDNLHPNDVGYAKMSYNWYRAMGPVLGPSAARWPAGTNPYAATKAYLCAAVNPFDYGSPSDCRWWYLRTVVSTVDGVPLQTPAWQTVRKASRSYRTLVQGYYRITAFRGRAVREWVPAHTATRHRLVSVWSER